MRGSRHSHRHGAAGRSGPLPAVLALACALALALGTAGPARAQDDDDPDGSGTGGAAGQAGGSPLDAAMAAAKGDPAAAAAADSAAAEVPEGPGFLQSITFTPTAGVRANVRQYTYYMDWASDAKLKRAATATQALNWSWEQYRKQEKTVENRKGSLNYNFGKQLPLVTTVTGNWNWTEDRTTNTAGFANLYKVDNKLVNFNTSGHKMKALGLTHSVRAGGNFTDQASLNQAQANDFREGTANGNLQTGWEPARGVVLVGRVAATATGGTRLLAGFSSPSSASGDSVGVGVYVNRGIGQGFVQLTRSNFEKQYLEFRRNANGLVDTVGVPTDQKVLDELESKDALSLELKHVVTIGPLKGTVNASHATDDLGYAVGVAGLKQRSSDLADLNLTYDAGRDSVSVTYKYAWRWDDQRIKAATASRGRQYNQERDLQFNWQRRLFAATRLMLQYHEGLVQDIAERRYNEYDKDRLAQDLSARLDRGWAGRFRTSMVFSYRQSQDISIRGGSSSNNNRKDSYELAPGYTWDLAPWFILDQSYRLYIQYTDYLYSYLESVTREDDYNKRGDLVTKVTCKPNNRLSVTVRHDWNRRFNATKTIEDAAGSAFYHRDLEQDISKIDLDFVYTAAPGITIECSTYRTRDDKTAIGRTVTETRTDSGELVVGGRVDRKWGARQQVEVSAMVKKINAFGPSITASSADFWEADVWLKWQF